MYAIIGASGNTGRIIAETLLTHGKSVRVIARDAAKLQPLAEQGAELFPGDSSDASFLTQALSGVTAVYTLTPLNPHAEDFRAFQNSVGSAVAQAISATGVRYVVNLSSLGAHLSEGTGPILGLHDQEKRLNAVDGVNVLHLRPTYFMENLLGSISGIKQMGVLGTPLRVDISFPLIATPDIAAVAAARLLSLDFSGKQVLDLLGPRDYTLAEITPILGAAIDRPDLAYVQFPYEAAEQGMVAAGLSPDVARLMVELNRSINEGKAISGTQRRAENNTPTTIEQFAQTFAAVYHAS